MRSKACFLCLLMDTGRKEYKLYLCLIMLVEFKHLEPMVKSKMN